MSKGVYWLLGLVAGLFLIDHSGIPYQITPEPLGDSSVKREVIFFINGTMSSRAGAARAAGALEQKTNTPVVMLYNQTKGLGVHDVLETVAQKYVESNFRTPNDLFNAVGFFANLFTFQTRTEQLKNFRAVYEQYLEQNYKIVIVAHSQGNFFANELYDLIAADLNTPKNAGGVCGLDVVAVSTPASRTVGSGAYFISKYDRPIGVLPTALPAREENSNTNQASQDKFHHEFIRSYLEGDDTGPKIITAITKAFAAMSYPVTCTAARDRISVTPTKENL